VSLEKPIVTTFMLLVYHVPLSKGDTTNSCNAEFGEQASPQNMARYLLSLQKQLGSR
jgi:hypothetical protein